MVQLRMNDSFRFYCWCVHICDSIIGRETITYSCIIISVYDSEQDYLQITAYIPDYKV